MSTPAKHLSIPPPQFQTPRNNPDSIASQEGAREREREIESVQTCIDGERLPAPSIQCAYNTRSLQRGADMSIR